MADTLIEHDSENPECECCDCHERHETAALFPPVSAEYGDTGLTVTQESTCVFCGHHIRQKAFVDTYKLDAWAPSPKEGT